MATMRDFEVKRFKYQQWNSVPGKITHRNKSVVCIIIKLQSWQLLERHEAF
jgi:hypothetical protein